MARSMRPLSRLRVLLPSLEQNAADLSVVQQTRVLHAACPQIYYHDSLPWRSRSVCSEHVGTDWHLAEGRRGPADLIQHRHFSSATPTEEMPEMPEDEFHGKADTLLENLHEMMDTIVEEEDIPDSDVEFGQGVLTLRLGPYGTYVYNKQTPNRQIWMSSPVSGPVRYDFMDGKWIYRRDEHELMDRLTSELSELLGKDVGNA